MGPVVHKLEKDYAGRVEVRRYMVDEMTREHPDFAMLSKLAEAVKFQVTPTLLVVSAKGEVHGRYEGVTSYFTLSRDLENELRPNP